MQSTFSALQVKAQSTGAKRGAYRMPRPKLPEGEGKRLALNMRATKELRTRLEAAAAASGRSLAQEAEMRLESSFRAEDAVTIMSERMSELLGGGHNASFLMWLSQILSSIDEELGTRWVDPGANLSINITLGDLMRMYLSDRRGKLAEILMRRDPDPKTRLDKLPKIVAELSSMTIEQQNVILGESVAPGPTPKSETNPLLEPRKRKEPQRRN